MFTFAFQWNLVKLFQNFYESVKDQEQLRHSCRRKITWEN